MKCRKPDKNFPFPQRERKARSIFSSTADSIWGGALYFHLKIRTPMKNFRSIFFSLFSLVFTVPVDAAPLPGLLCAAGPAGGMIGLLRGDAPAVKKPFFHPSSFSFLPNTTDFGYKICLDSRKNGHFPRSKPPVATSLFYKQTGTDNSHFQP